MPSAQQNAGLQPEGNEAATADWREKEVWVQGPGRSARMRRAGSCRLAGRNAALYVGGVACYSYARASG